MNDPAVIQEMLRNARTIAVVGMSDKTWRASHNIGRYLANKGYRVVPVNPTLDAVLDMPCYPDLAAAQPLHSRNSAKAPSIWWTCFAPRNTCPPWSTTSSASEFRYLWLQDGVMHAEAIARARAAGVKCIQNDCIFREHAHLVVSS